VCAACGALAGWELAGEICSGLEKDGTGIVWECPLLVELPVLSGPTAMSPIAGATGAGQQLTGPTTGQALHPTSPLCNNAGVAAGAAAVLEVGDGPSSTATATHYASSSYSSVMSSVLDAHPGASAANGHPTDISAHPPSPPPALRRRHFFCISPDACTNPTIYYLGDYVDGCDPHIAGSTTIPTGPAIAPTPGVRQSRFLITEALGPFRLDLGDILYAPNTLMDPSKVCIPARQERERLPCVCEQFS
jgi:sucrose-6-phosphate hydrolase SacC (GH32 family)